MKLTIMRMAAAAIFVAAAGCSGAASPTAASFAEQDGPVMARQAGTLTFSSTQSYDTQTPQTASGGTGAIGFTGSLQTSTPCYDVTAAVRTRGSTVTVTVTAASSGSICTQVITNNNYTGSVSGAAPGTYTFQVVHVTGGSRTTAFSGQVTVS
ncbi:MAG TPA: hypothetical protein VFQ45_13635 [Longimicrobium sp.]|nr:hypothetical protein [Longimicrobium sp.]